MAAVSPTSLTLRTPAGTRTIALDGATAFYEGRTKTTASAVEVGEVVAVRLRDPRAAAPVAAVVRLLPAHIAGWVTSTQGDTLTVVDVSGFTRVIRTTSETEIRKDGQAAQRSALVAGAFVRAVGAVAEDGTTLTAERIAIGAGRGPDERRKGGSA